MMVHFIGSRQEWNALAEQLPGAQFLQSWEWGEAKAAYGWTVERYHWLTADGASVAAAQILLRSVRFGFLRAAVAYVPKGPLLDWNSSALRDQVLADLESFARTRGVIQLKIDPDLPLGIGLPGTPEEQTIASGEAAVTMLRNRSWLFSREQIQLPNTVALDITPPEDSLLARMKQKTRYNIRVAQRHGVTIIPGSVADFPVLYRMYAETGTRDGFIVRPEGYYHAIWGGLMRAGYAMPLLAIVEDQPVAALVLFRFGQRAWYMHGMSTNLSREKMPNYLLQWEGIRWAKAQGCSCYDFWGAPDRFDPKDRMWGVFQFKRGFGAEVVRHIGAWDFAPSALRYKLYNTLLPAVLQVARIFARRRTRAAAEREAA
jgi:peptidoglycan pentaglycine glycine transferase (the first glycine)